MADENNLDKENLETRFPHNDVICIYFKQQESIAQHEIRTLCETRCDALSLSRLLPRRPAFLLTEGNLFCLLRSQFSAIKRCSKSKQRNILFKQ